MPEALYERYKDALRRGHVAALRGRTEESIAAYEEAAALAPDRPLAHTSRGGVLSRAGRADEALVAYAAAIRLAPRDEAALAGRAEALAQLGRRNDAADAFDLLADVQEAAGRLGEACDTARRALELAESKARRRHVESLTGTLGRMIGDQDAEVSLARALRVLEGDVSALTNPQAATGRQSIGPSPLAAAAAEPAPEPEPEQDPAALVAEADSALGAGDLATARNMLLQAGRIHAAAGRYTAALDVCHEALAFAPSDAALHLILVDIYVARGWHGPAAEKLLLLGRLLELDDDEQTRKRVCAVVAERFSDDERLVAMCA